MGAERATRADGAEMAASESAASTMPASLPVDAALPGLRDALAGPGVAVLQAPPGAGKTTRVPLALLDEPWLAGQRILMLEPRRLAARAAAARMADTLGERIGETVGYRVRMDTRVGPRTRVEVLTEGVLTRILQSDPALEGVGLVIFDEFHERSLHADLGLALTLQARTLLREDLRILVMSATLDGERVARLLGDDETPHGVEESSATSAPIVTAEGRQHPVETRFRAPASGAGLAFRGRIEPAVVDATLDAIERETGDILVFLPGAAEIRRTAATLEDALRPLGSRIRVIPLHGTLSREDQDRAIAPSPSGERKVVLATSIAETSLTIEGVRVVIDSGLMRVPRFSPRTGMTRLETVPVTRDAADQRRGRAGRVEPGVCYRLWSQADDARLAPHRTPEILSADLAPLALELAAWGTADPAELRWLDSPPPSAFAQARELLAALGALDDDGAITEHGRRMAALPTHPRLAHMLLEGKRRGLGETACDLAALLADRDILRRGSGETADVDLRLRLEILRKASRGDRPIPRTAFGHEVHRGGVVRARAEAAEWRRRLGIGSRDLGAGPGDSRVEGRGGEGRSGDGRRGSERAGAGGGAGSGAGAEAAGLLLAFAFPDRIARRRSGGGGRFLMRNGRGAALPPGQPLAESEWIVAAELDDRGRESRIFLATPADEAELIEHFANEIEVEEAIEWDGEAGVVAARRRERLGAIVVRDAPLREPDPDAVASALLDGVAREGLGILPWTRAARQLRERLLFLRRHDDRWPDVSDEALLEAPAEWLGAWVQGMRRRDDLQRLEMTQVLEAMLPWDLRAALDEAAPTHTVVPSGSRIPIDYSDPEAPVLAVRIQELFGLESTPRIAGGRVPLTVHLLSPAHRPVQVTRDLASFWREGYFEVRKDLRGRYPKHAWPDDPLTAEPTRRVRRRGEDR